MRFMAFAPITADRLALVRQRPRLGVPKKKREKPPRRRGRQRALIDPNPNQALWRLRRRGGSIFLRLSSGWLRGSRSRRRRGGLVHALGQGRHVLVAVLDVSLGIVPLG